MRTLTVTTLATAGLLCLVPNAGAVPAAAGKAGHLTVTGQAAHLRPAVGEIETVRWTITNTGDGHLDHVRLVASVPNGWIVKDGPGCVHAASNLRCEIGGLDAGRRASVQIPMVVHRPLGAVQLRAWAAGTVGRLNVPGPETSFQVFVVAHQPNAHQPNAHQPNMHQPNAHQQVAHQPGTHR